MNPFIQEFFKIHDLKSKALFFDVLSNVLELIFEIDTEIQSISSSFEKELSDQKQNLFESIIQNFTIQMKQLNQNKNIELQLKLCQVLL